MAKVSPMIKNERKASVRRATNETSVDVSINLDGTGVHDMASGVGFFDHMLDQLSKHSLIDISAKAEGDLHIDAHHTVEDIGWTLGAALQEAIGDKKGITRYGHAYVAMDEALSRVALDFSGRPFLVWNVHFTLGRLGDMDTELFREFFQSFSQAAGLTLHVDLIHGENNHHIIESIFKAAAKAIRMAVTVDTRAADQLPSTKGAL